MRLLKSFTTVGGATIASRILGFVREILIAALIGVGPVADAFYAAFRFPNLFRRLFAEGAFNTAFIPLFAKELEGGGQKVAEEFARQVFSVLFVVLLTLTALAILTMPFLVSTIIAPFFGEGTEKTLLTVELARIMFPYLFCMSLVAMLSGIMNAYRRYFVAAFVPVLLNVILIIALAICHALDTGNTPLTGRVIAFAVFIAGIAQLILLWVAVRRLPFRLKLSRPRISPSVKRLLVLAVPAAIAGGITQINLLVGQVIASAQESAITMLQFADRIYQLPLGVIGIAIGVVLLPELSRDLKAEEYDRAASTQNQALTFAMFLTLPSAAALMVMPELVTSVLYERGAFDAVATTGTAAALWAFAFGLPAFVLIKVFSPAFFARENTKTPMYYAAANAGVNIVLSLVLFQYYGHVGIAAATSIAAWLNVGLLVFGMIGRGYWHPDQVTLRRATLMLLASIIMGVGLFFLLSLTADFRAAGDFIPRFLILVSAVLGGAFVYFCLTFASGAVDFRQILRNMRRASNDHNA